MEVSKKIWILLGLTSIIFHIFLIFSGLIPNLVSRPLHMALAIPWVILYTKQNDKSNFLNITLTFLGIFSCLWIAYNNNSISDQYGFIENNFQLLISIFLLFLVLEMARRSVGFPLPFVAFVSLLYAVFGDLIPGEFGHAGIPINSFFGNLVLAEGGIWGTLTNVSVTIVSIFVIFGCILNAGEAGEGFMNIAKLVAGKLKGGAAKVSVVSSALFGSISGSASANVASTGSITLPTMIKLGYPKRLSAAVEAVASSGGQIMPPLMGAGAFVMVELTGIPYEKIIIASFFPAILFFFTVWVGINFYSNFFDLKPIQKKDMPNKKETYVTFLFFAVPFICLLFFMFLGYTPQYSASIAILLGFLLLFFNIRKKFDFKIGYERFLNACILVGKQISLIASIILCASIIIGVLSMTGLGIKLTSLIISFSDNNVWLALLFTALACLILGMEVPTTAAYIICVSVAGPALIDMGLDVLLVHLFVFWFALLSTITPPVCGTVFIASGMVDENWIKVSITSMTLGIGLYFIPLGMIANQDLIKLETEPMSAIFDIIKIGLGLLLFSISIIQVKNLFFKILVFIFGLFILFI
mgnify:FL=1